MRRFLSGFRSLFVILAVVVVAGCGSKEENAAKYAKSMSDRHEALVGALVLWERMVINFHKDATVIDRGDYIAAEEDMAGYVARIGSLRDLGKIPLPGNDEDLRLTHDHFMISVSYLYESQALLEDSGYDQGSSAMALGMWEEARKNFLTFAELLNQIEGKPALDGAPAPGDATISEMPAPATP